MNLRVLGRVIPTLFAVFLFHTVPAFAQKGSIAGVVVDAETGETLIGANVVIDGTTTGATTDLDGRFLIEGIDAGTYTVVFSYIGYSSVTVSNVAVAAREVTELDLTMSVEAIGLDEVIVEAEAVQNTEAALLRERQKAVAVSDAISAEAMSQSGSGDAARAMTKVTGASVVAGKYVYIRGLGGRYSNAQLNGATLPSADPDQNAVQLDLFPVGLLDNIVAIKSFTPDKPGSFTGGNVDVRTKAFPDQLTFKASSSVSYNSAVSLSDRFLTGPSSSTDWLGYDTRLRGIPDPLKSTDVVIPRSSQARSDAALAQELDRLSQSFSNVMVPVPGEAGLNQSHSMSFGNQVPLFGKPFGVIVSSTYGREFSGYEDGRSAQYEATDPDANELNTTFDFSDLNSQEKANWGLMANLAYRPHAHHEIAFNGLRTQEGEQLGRYQVGIYPKNSLPPVQYETYVLQYTERSAQSFQLRGEHYFSSLAGLRADWNASLTSTTQSEPDLRFFFDQFVQIDFNQDGIGDTTVYDINLGSSNATPPSRVFRDMDEMNEEGSVNFTLPIRVNNANKFTVKFGGTYLNKDRDFKERKYNYRDNALDFSDFGGNIFSFFTNENVGIIAESNGRYTFGNTIEDGSRKANNYDGLQRIYAGYGMVEMPLFRNLRFVGGVRYESTDMRIVSEDSTKSIGRIEEQDILPSANLIYALTENANLRISATRTLARPTFREIAPFTSFSFAGGPELSGNPELRRTLISNYDVRVEWFLQPGEVMAISAFYKYFQDPIERVFISNNNQVTFVNVPTAEVRGAEFEMRLGMGRFTPLLNHLWITSNLALIESEVQVPQRELELAAGFDIDTHRPFQGQSPYVLNIGLSYERPSLSNLHLSATYNKFGERLSSVALGGAPNIFEQPRDDLYVSAGIRILKMFDIKFSVDNLLDSDYLESQEYKEREFVTRRYVTGRTFKLSFSYGF